MKTILKNSMLVTLLFTICSMLFSFSSPKGGDEFEIYLNNKLVIQQYVVQMKSVKSLQLDPRISNEELVVKYYHCGQVGKSRHIILKNDQDKVLKDWRFNDYNGKVSMSCPVKEILALQKENNSVNLYYSSNELPKGRLLASIILAKENSSKVTVR